MLMGLYQTTQAASLRCLNCHLRFAPVLDKLDAVGNTTAAIGKGFAIGSAALTALALFAAYMTSAGIETIDISKPYVMACLFVGAMLPYLFSAMAIDAVGRAAMSMIQEVRRQFRSIPQLQAALDVMKRNGDTPQDQWSKEDQETFDAADGKAEYAKCVDISTKSAIREMVKPGMLAILTPVAIGFGFKAWQGGSRRCRSARGIACWSNCLRRAFSTISVKCRRCMGQCQKDV